MWECFDVRLPVCDFCSFSFCVCIPLSIFYLWVCHIWVKLVFSQSSFHLFWLLPTSLEKRHKEGRKGKPITFRISSFLRCHKNATYTYLAKKERKTNLNLWGFSILKSPKQPIWSCRGSPYVHCRVDTSFLFPVLTNWKIPLGIPYRAGLAIVLIIQLLPAHLRMQALPLMHTACLITITEPSLLFW